METEFDRVLLIAGTARFARITGQGFHVRSSESVSDPCSDDDGIHAYFRG